MPNKTYYEILGITKDASQSDIRKAYKELVLKWHPDKNPGQDTKEKFQKIQEAYEILSDQRSRALYDATLLKTYPSSKTSYGATSQKAQQQEGFWFDVKHSVEDFTGREEELKDLHSKIQRSDPNTHESHRNKRDRVTVITGLGGIGKTELAREYAHKHYQDYDGNVIWINAESYETIADSFYRTAEKLGIRTETVDGDKGPVSSIVENIYRYFSNKKSLFIFDNGDNVDNGIRDFLPFSVSLHPNTAIPYALITSRNQEWGRSKTLDLNVFSEKQAAEFVNKRLKITDKLQDKEIKQLAETLGYFPLALQQAIYYIQETDTVLRHTRSRFKISDYLKRYKEQTGKLLDFKFPEGNRDSYTETTFTTWNTTFDKIKGEEEYGKQALEILDIMAYFSYKENISREIFLSLVNNDNIELRCSVRPLVKYSIINGEQQQSILNINKLVQDVVQLKLKEQGKEEKVLSKALDLLKKSLQEGKFIEFPNHVESVLKHANEYIQRESKNGNKSEGLQKKCKEIQSLLSSTEEVSNSLSQMRIQEGATASRGK